MSALFAAILPAPKTVPGKKQIVNKYLLKERITSCAIFCNKSLNPSRHWFLHWCRGDVCTLGKTSNERRMNVCGVTSACGCYTV